MAPKRLLRKENIFIEQVKIVFIRGFVSNLPLPAGFKCSMPAMPSQGYEK
jgi:hypothetical protein